MSNKTKNLIIIITACLVILPVLASAYTLLEKLPGATDIDTSEDGQQITLSGYLTWLFRFALAAAAFLAVLHIVIGGLRIIIAGAKETEYGKGREMIEMALWGLLLAISSVLILGTINPDLIKTGLTIPGVTIESEPTASAITCEGYCFSIWQYDSCIDIPITSPSGPAPNGYIPADGTCEVEKFCCKPMPGA